MISTTRHDHFLAVSLLLLAACSKGADESTVRTASAKGTAALASHTLTEGALVDAAITDAISSRHAKAGDAFTARVVEDVRTAGGWVAIPAGSTVQGTITAVSSAPNARSTGTLTLAVSSVTVRGKTYDLYASIDSLQTVTQGRGIETVDAARVAGGAAAGAILGRVIGGDSRGTIVGGVAGGATGAAVSAIMKDVDIVLPAGSHLMLTLKQKLTVMAQ